METTNNMMDNQTVKTRYNLLVLTDFSDVSYAALKYAISLAKSIKSTIHVCHIANPGKIVESDNQASVLRDLETKTKKIEQKMGAIIDMITAEGINSIPYYSMGNIICEFEEQIEIINPDVVIIGKKIGNLSLSGKITSYLMNEYSGSLLIVGRESEFQNDTKISLGCNNSTLDRYDPHMLFSLDRQTKAPLTLLNVKNLNGSGKEIIVPQTWWKSIYEIDRDIKFVYEKDSRVVDGMLNYISRNNIGLLCIGKGKPRNFFQKMMSKNTSKVSEVINKVQIPILVMGAI